MDLNRHERQIRFISEDGHCRLKNTKVTVIGGGGLGSHVIQQLAFLGVQRIILVDKDMPDITSLNRLVGARHDDHLHGLSKVDIATRLVGEIDPKITLIGIHKNLISQEAFDAVKSADFVFGCVDHDGPRQVLTELCCAYEIPYLDLGSEIKLDQRLEYGGRVCFSHGGEGCLVCQDLISSEEAGDYFMSSEAKVARKEMYGIPIDELQDSGPSVVTINGVLASLATTEFLVHVTGIRKAQKVLTYLGSSGKVLARTHVPVDCYYCKKLYGMRAKANVERYLESSK